MKNFKPSEWLQEQKTEAKSAADNTPLKEDTDIEESTFFKKAKNLLENAGFSLVKESNIENIQDDFDFEDLKWLFNNYNSDYARSYGPNGAYEKVLEEFSETHDGRVPDSYAEWEEIMGWPIDDPAPDDTWYN